MTRVKSFIINVVLLLGAIILFALSNPGFIFPNGLSLVAWFAYIPLFILISRASIKPLCLYAFVYGFVGYALYVSWLVIFTPGGSIAIEGEYGLWLLITCVLIKLAYTFFPKMGWLVGALIFCGYEYLKTLGFAGFSYGVTAYTQWRNIHLIQIADLFGVWGLSFLIVFTSAWCAVTITDSIKQKKLVVNHKISVCLWGVCLIVTLVYGFVSQKDYSSCEQVTVAAIQHNTDPWLGDIDVYTKDVDSLIALSQEALSAHPEVQLVVWPETAIVPSIVYHYTLRQDRKRVDLIKNFLSFVDDTEQTFVIGNDHAEVSPSGERMDWNSVLVFEPKKNVIPPEPKVYKKIHLVPFTETFPFADVFAELYNKLSIEAHLWLHGDSVKVFTSAGLTFSTPICFEDTFGDGVRAMCNAGARAIVNLSNDAWSKSLSCQNQHLAMALFRCVENRVPAVRSTASGQTCIIDPNGTIISMIAPFTKAWLVGSIPVLTEDKAPTLYQRIGDILGVFYVLLSCVLLSVGYIRKVYTNTSKK
ncbi:MAG: apolipoprotein N-acyltransferase [Treponema sp.]|nr:apolipoprotein N-acyltransferase [Treponema sp.]